MTLPPLTRRDYSLQWLVPVALMAFWFLVGVVAWSYLA